MLVVGLTGGIGSGKSTVSGIFASLGAPILDADLIARELVMPAEPAYQAILSHYGPQILKPDNSIHRQRLRDIIFEHATEKQWLENLLHPLIRDQIEKRLALLQAPYCIVVIPLLIESPAYPYIDRILLVDTTAELQKIRAIARDPSCAPLIESILQSQTTREKRQTAADDIITNDGTIEALVTQVEALDRQYRG